MKIHSGDPLSSVPRPVSKTSGASKSPAFADVLTQRLSSKQPERAAPLMPMAPIMRPIPTNDSAQLYQTTERVLDAMERYQYLIGNGGVTLRAVEPAVGELRMAIDALTPLMETISADHPALGVARQTLLTAAKEIARFNQGEYVDD
jgi:hypothetical protein